MAYILVIDDDADIRSQITVVLEDEGHEVATADSRMAGREAVNKRQPELIILDVMMDEPDDGFVLAQELRRAGVETPILMLTSISKVTGQEYGRDSEFVPVNEFFTKPISRDSLIAAVERLLKQG